MIQRLILGQEDRSLFRAEDTTLFAASKHSDRTALVVRIRFVPLREASRIQGHFRHQMRVEPDELLQSNFFPTPPRAAIKCKNTSLPAVTGTPSPGPRALISFLGVSRKILSPPLIVGFFLRSSSQRSIVLISAERDWPRRTLIVEGLSLPLDRAKG